MATSGGMPRILGYTRQGHPGEPIGGASAASLESMRGETLGTFLKTRRDKTVPESIGLDPGSAPRRVPGLRREELARLAGVSVGYYTRIEQDQTGTASTQVLNALASVMRLDDVERTHLYNLAHSNSPSRMIREAPEKPHRRVLSLFESLHEAIPAVILGRRGDILAWNRSGHELLFENLPFEAPTDIDQRPCVPRLFFLATPRCATSTVTGKNWRAFTLLIFDSPRDVIRMTPILPTSSEICRRKAMIS